MKESSSTIITIGILTGFISVLARFSVAGWLFMLGLISIIVFGILHIIFLLQINKHYDGLTKSLKKMAWVGILTFPLIFVFQFDFGDSAGNFYVYEYLTGENNWNFEYYAYYIALVSGLAYVINFVVWRIKIKKIR